MARLMWVRTVAGLRTSSSAISSLDRPVATHPSISRSRSVRASRPGAEGVPPARCRPNRLTTRRVTEGDSKASPAATTRTARSSSAGSASFRTKQRRQPARYGPPSVEKTLGALPVVASFCRRLDLRGIVDRVCPVREVATLTHGQVICALVANRLTSPTPLWRVEEWARAWAVEEVFGIQPRALKDDRIGRALDAIAPKLDQIVESVGARAIASFGLEVARLHWDMTSVSLYGAYQEPEERFIAPRFGHPKDRRPDLKQIQTGLGVSGAGGVPVFHRAYDGGAGEVAHVAEAMRALRELAGPRRLVGDSKLVSYANLRDLLAAGVDFIAPASKTYVPAKVLGALDIQTAAPVDYVAERDQGKPPEQRGSYRVVEDTMTITGKRKADPVLPVRRVVVWSSARAGAAATARARKLARATGDLERLQRGLGSRHYPDADAVTARLAAIARSRRVAVCCAPRSAPTRPPASRPWRGGSTRPRWPPSRPPTAGMGC
jgi:Domain of unknown function (DUF4277)